MLLFPERKVMLRVRKGKASVVNKIVGKCLSPLAVFPPVDAVAVPLVTSKEVMNCLDGGES